MGASEATLLNMLNISPFSFGLVIQQVFDNGSIYNPEVLDITEETLHKRFLEVSATALSLVFCLAALGASTAPEQSVLSGVYHEVLQRQVLSLVPYRNCLSGSTFL